MTPDYARQAYDQKQHHARFSRHVEAEGVTCQECGGRGGETVPIMDFGMGPWEPCGWCEGTGKMPRHRRGVWLSWKRSIRGPR